MIFVLMKIALYLLALAGAWATLWWSIENFKSVVQIIIGVIVKCFKSEEKKSLIKKYGTWAGKDEQD